MGWLMAMPPSSARISCSADTQLMTTCGSRSRIMAYSVSTKSPSLTRAGDRWNTFSTPVTAVWRT